jgi:hypothetical protein
MMFLIIKLNYASVVMPEKYPSAQCTSIANEINKIYSKEAVCIPAPNFVQFSILNSLWQFDDKLPKGFCTADGKRCNIEIK